ncbi:hypothetical protein V2J09_019816 [Rumex salicifolius]
MDPEQPESRYERSQERYDDDSPVDNVQHDSKKSRESSRHRSKDGKRSRRDERELNSRDKDLLKDTDELKEVDKETRVPGKDRVSSREKRKDEKEEHQKHRSKGKSTEKDHERDKNREREHERDTDKRERRKEKEHDVQNETEREFERGREERGKERNSYRDKEREREKRDRVKDKLKEMERERQGDRDKERGYERNEKEKGKEKPRERERDFDEDKDKVRDKEKTSKRNRDDGYDRNKDLAKEANDRDTDAAKGIGSPNEEESGMIAEQEKHVESAVDSKNQSVSELKDRLLRMKEERLQRKSEGSEVLSWVNKLGKLEERRREEKQKALLRSKIFEEQDKIDEDDDDDQIVDGHTAGGLAGVKVLHGLDKVVEGGSVVLTLKDQHILAGGDINEEVDMLENVEIGEQKQRDEAYKAAKKKTGIYDKFNDQIDSEKKILPQYDDPVTEEGVILDASGRFSGEAEKKLEELRLRLKGPLVKNKVDDLNSSVRVTSDYYTPEEMLQFKKPKKKKSLRKKEKFDIDALEAEAIAAGLGVSDLGSRSDPNRQAAKEEQKRSEAEKRNSAYQAAKAKADEASRALRFEQSLDMQKDDVDDGIFVEEADDYQKCLDRVRKIALIKYKDEHASGPDAIALIAASKTNKSIDDLKSGEPLENEVVITEMEEFVQGLHIDEEVTKPGGEDFFMEEDEAPKSFKEENREEAGGEVDAEDSEKHVVPENAEEDDIVADETIHEAPLGKGMGGVLKHLKLRGALKETVEWGGRNMDKKKSKLVGIIDEGGEKEIRIERTDEYGRILTPKESFRLLSHRFHGKGPGKMKQEKRQKQFFDEMKLKNMKNSDTPSESVQRMREAQARMKTPYLVLSGNVKPGQTSDPTSGFATVEKDFPGSLTPMLGDKKVEHFLGIKRKADTQNSSIPKKPKP